MNKSQTRVKNYADGYRPEMHQLLPHDVHRVLEIGCCEGNFRNHFPDPVEYWGVEPSPATSAVAQTKLTRVLTGFYDDVAALIPDTYFDLVVCNDVIEHIADTWSFLRSIKGKLKPGGSLVGSVPNVRAITNLWNLVVHKDWHYEQSGILDNTHLRFFTPKSLSQTLTQCGFKVEQLNSINEIPTQIPRALKRILLFPLGLDTAYSQIGFSVSVKGENE